ncbi:unnamed protein product [Brachionus calyciflorus]|uniref:Uncharacterized protein n=1 Tax=Brachionus calyciflorus TaxID=104777 RepID=A0A813VS08_9BILA|nr:unnamed protein product [Brachionus calyciflorus]
MDDLMISLSCFHKIPYKDIRKKYTIKCTECSAETMNLDDWLKIPGIQIALKEKEFELERQKFEECLEKFNFFKSDPDYYIGKSLEDVTQELDLSRELIIKEINAYYDKLRRKIENEFALKKSKFTEAIRTVENYEQEFKKMSVDGSNFYTKINKIDTNLSNLASKIKFIEEKIKDLGEQTLDFVPVENVRIEKVCCKVLKKNVDFFLKETILRDDNEICDLKVIGCDKIVSASFDGSINLITYQDETMNCVDVSDDDNRVNCICLLDDDLFATGFEDKSIKIWNKNTKKIVKTLLGHSGSINALILSKSGHLISASADKSIIKWNYKNGEKVSVYNGHENRVRCLEEMPNGVLISIGNDGVLKFWNENGLGLATIGCYYSPKGKAICVKFIKDYKFACGYNDGMIRIWNYETGTCVKEKVAHYMGVSCLNLFKNEQLVSSSWDGTIKFWNLETFNCENTIEGDDDDYESFSCFQVNEKFDIITGNERGLIKIWRLFD